MMKTLEIIKQLGKIEVLKGKTTDINQHAGFLIRQKEILESYAKEHAIEFAKHIDKTWFNEPFGDEAYQKNYTEWLNQQAQP